MRKIYAFCCFYKPQTREQYSRLLLSFACLIVLAIFSGCARITTTGQTPYDNKEKIAIAMLQERLATKQNWSIKALAEFSGKNSFRGKMDWTKHGDEFTSILVNSKGNVVMNARGNVPSGIGYVELSNGRVLQKINLSTAFSHFLGAPLKILDIESWLVGAPSPHLPIDSITFDGTRAISFSQSGWSISFHDFIKQGKGEYPVHILASYKNFNLKLQIYERRQLMSSKSSS